MFNRFLNRAAAIQCLSEKELNASRGKTSKFIGTNGCTLPESRKQQFSEGKIKFCYIGRLDWYIKGLDILLDAFKFLSEEGFNQDCELCMYGPDYQGRYAHIESMIAERNLQKFVTLNPPIFGKDKENILLDSDIFIQTSRTEGMPVGILEAFSYGLPCLITNGTTLGDFVERYNAGWVAETNAKSVFEALVCAIKGKKNFCEKSVGAQTLINENFVWDRIAADAVIMYQKFAGMGEE